MDRAEMTREWLNKPDTEDNADVDGGERRQREEAAGHSKTLSAESAARSCGTMDRAEMTREWLNKPDTEDNADVDGGERRQREEAAGHSKTLSAESAARSCGTMDRAEMTREWLNKPDTEDNADVDGGSETHRPPSPVPSCLSMRSEASIPAPPLFSSGPPKSETHRPPSPVPSCLSMRSEASIPAPPLFSSGPPKSETHRPPSPVPSCLSMRREASIPAPPFFSSGPPNDQENIACNNCQRNPAKYCKTCKASYCMTHLMGHINTTKVHELVPVPKASPVEVSSLHWSRSGIAWVVPVILGILVSLIYIRFSQFSHPEGPAGLPQLRVMLVGKTGSGKSASGNTILGREAFKAEASALPVTKYCESKGGIVEGNKITVIDTPGITSRNDSWLSEKENIALGSHVFLFVIQLGRFTEEDSNEVKGIQTHFGEVALKFTIVLFTGGDQLKGKLVEDFLQESSGLQTLVNSAGGGYHVFNNINPKGHQQVKELLQKIEVLLRKNMGFSYSHGLHEQMKITLKKEEEKRQEFLERIGKGKHLELIKNMDKRLERKFKEQMKRTMTIRFANATAILNELRENIKATTEQNWNYLTTLIHGLVSGSTAVILVVITKYENKIVHFLLILFSCVLFVTGIVQNYVTFLIAYLTVLIVGVVTAQVEFAIDKLEIKIRGWLRIVPEMKGENSDSLKSKSDT
ncbi:uncharacterized protein LOC121719420 isoform X2 [Alosa sapidissima]|nr:uncharacterized protein LOC121719420 isoform X2 [Alosa sapidissima]